MMAARSLVMAGLPPEIHRQTSDELNAGIIVTAEK
jgi:hypothetical protein